MTTLLHQERFFHSPRAVLDMIVGRQGRKILAKCPFTIPIVPGAAGESSYIQLMLERECSDIFLRQNASLL